MTIKKIIISIIISFTWLQAGTVDGTSNIWVVTRGSTLKQHYFNATTTGVRITFTPDETGFSTVQAFVEKTGASTDIGGCTESQFDGSAMELGAGNGGAIAGTTWSPGGGFTSGSQYTLDLYYADLYAALGNSFTEGQRLYVAIKFNLNNDDWSCPANSNGNDDGDDSNDSQKGNNAYYYHLMDRVYPTLASITDHDDTNLNSSSGTTTASTNYTNSPDGVGQAKSTTKMTVGSELVKTVKLTWTKDSGAGASIAEVTTDTDAAAGSSLTHDQDLTNATRYDITYKVEDVAGNVNTYADYNIWFDNAAPTVEGVYSEESNGAMLAQGVVADFYVKFNETAMDYSGAPQIALLSNDGETTNVNAATFSDGSDKIYFDWTIPDGAYSKFLDYENTTALSAASGGYIKDRAGNTATLTLAAPPAWGSQGGNASLSGASTAGYFGVDGDDPADNTVGAVVSKGGTEVANYWNDTNTSVEVTVPVGNDATLEDGTIQLQAEADGNFEAIGDPYTILNGDIGNGTTKVMTVTDAQVEGLTGYSNGDVLTWRAVLTDKSSNATTYSNSATTLTVSIDAPTVVSVLGGDNTGVYKKFNEKIEMTVKFSANATVAGTPQLTFNTANTPGTADAAVDYKSGTGSTNLIFEYTVGATHYSTDLDYKSTTALNLNGGTIKDAGGNAAVLTLPALGTLPGARAIYIDGVAPAAFQVGDVITDGDPVVAGYWNEDNTGVKVTVPIANDNSLASGKAYIQAKTTGENFATIGGSTDIGAGDKGTNVTYTIAAGDLEGINAFNLGSTVTITAILEDYAGGPDGTGNKTTGTESATTLIIDQADPAAFSVGAVTTVTEPIVTGKWNLHNTAITVVVPIATENTGPTLLNGNVQIIAKTASSAYENIGNAETIAAGDRGGDKTLTIAAAALEAIDNNISDGDVITISAIITDAAGNKTTGTVSTTTLTVDQTAPTIDEVTTDANDGLTNPYKVATTVDIKVSFNEAVVVVEGANKPALQLDTDDAPGSVLSEAIYNSGTGSKFPLFRLTVATNNYSEDLNYRATTSLIINDGTIRDAAGNNATLTLPALDDAKSLKNKKTLWIDGVLPTIKTVGAVTTTGDTIVTGFWNKKNTGLTVVVPLGTTDFSLRSGTIQLEAQAVGGGVTGNWTNIGAAATMTTETVGAGTQTISVAKSGTANADFEEINEFSDGDVVTIRAVVTDLAGNSSTFTASNTTLTVDQTYPSTSTTFKPSAAKSALTCCSAADDATYGQYWNEDHGAVNITVPFKNDPTLEGGYLQFQARAGTAGAWTPVGFRKTITSGQVAAAAPLTYGFDTNTFIQSRIQPDGTQNQGGQDEEEFGIDKIDSFANGLELYFRVMVADAAGNSIFSDISDKTIYIEERSATIKEVTSTNDNKAYKAGDKINITVESTAVFLATPNMTVTGTPQLSLETGDVQDAVVNYTSGTGTTFLTFEYTVSPGDSSLDINYLSTTALALNAGTILGPYGNDVTLTLPALANASALKQKKDIEIDTRPPSVTFTYDDPDSLVRFEDGEMVITATFNDELEAGTVPLLTVDFPANTAGDKTNVSMTQASGKVFTYKLPLVDNSDGLIAVSISAKDKALNPLTTTAPADSVHADTIITIDNTDPAAFTTGLVTLFGDTVSGSWFNKSTDSVKIVVPIDINDNSLLRGNIQVQMHVDGKMANNSWVTILPKDTLQVLVASVPKYRTKKEVLDILKPQGLAQGDSVFIRALINDQVGNSTNGATSASFFILDTLPPAVPAGKDVLITLTDEPDTTISNLQGESIFLTSLRDTLWTNDSLVFATQNWEDPKLDTEVLASGIQRYQYTLFESASNDKNGTYTTLRSYRFQTDTLDTVIIAIDSLTHNRWYYPELQAVDVAGNTSITTTYYKTFRYNARPIVDIIPDVTAEEDVLWEELIKVNDKDLLTLRSDVFSYALTVMKLDPTQTPIDSAVVDLATIAAEVTANGKVTFTPTKLDTASFVFRVIVTDNWTLKDTVDIDITVLPVNDPPILDLSSIAKMIFLEGANSDSINLTRYAYDEDNDTTDLKFSFKITSTLPDKGGYPTAKIGFLSNFNDGYKQSFISKLVDEFPASTIVQKNDAFLIYPSSVTQFRDPIKVDSLLQGDSTFAWIMPTDTASSDTNYFTSADMLVEFTVTDPSDSVGRDTVTFFINPLNDPPLWTNLPDTTIKENDSLYFDFADYLLDVDDSTLTISILPLTFGDNITIEPTKPFQNKATGIEYSSTARKEPVKFKPDLLWFGPNGPMVKNKTDSTLIQITAADDDTSAIDTFIVYVQRVPRPEIRMYVVQNNAFTNYYEIFLVDSVGKTKDLTLKIQSKAVTLDTAAAFTYVGHYNFKTKGTYTFEVDAAGVVGDTSVTKNLGLALAKMYATWSGRSADGQFQVIGKNGVVDFDQSVMILDSTLFEPHFNDRASYLLGNEAFRFKKSVEISMPGENEEIAIYQRSTGTGWIELPSITQGNRVMAYTEKMGYFRMGPKTLLVPGQTALQQNYPNPFNPVTTIEYDLGFVDGPYQKVSMTIYDILGRNVKTLVNEQKSIGRYRLKWNGKDQNGVNVSSGIYFVHLLTDMGRSQTKKIMLVR